MALLRRLNVYDIVFCINTLVCLSCCNIVLLCYAIIILMLILFNDVCFYYFSARWEVEASMMTIGQCANKVSVRFVKRSPRSCAGLIFCTDQLLYSLSLFLFFPRGSQHPRKTPKWCVRDSQSLCIFKSI